MRTAPSSAPARPLPDFFIVGAPKCGTTSLYHYLGTHRQLFLCPVKEPNFFCDQHLQVIQSEKKYRSLFAKVGDRQLCGEASAIYLFWKSAVPRILDWNPQAKIIALVRDPIEMTVSYHNEVVKAFEQNEGDLEKAWRRSSASLQSTDVGPRCLDPRLLDYRAVCRLGEQIDRLKAIVPEEQLKVIVFDDLRANAIDVYKDTLRFLEVPEDERTEFPVVNARNTHRSEALARLLVTPPSAIAQLKRVARRHFPAITKNIGRRLLHMNQLPNPSPKLSERLRAEMVAEFASDVRLLGTLINRDLSHWCREEA